MRKQFAKTVKDLLTSDPKLVVLLGDIGVRAFEDVLGNRVFNVGILEQATVGMAAGMAMEGLIPVVHTIAPFITERCIEQWKDDFGYQGLGGNIVSVGASYDYASLGCTHHCPADVMVLSSIPGINIFVPGTAEEFAALFRQNYNNGKLNYFRLSEVKNKTPNVCGYFNKDFTKTVVVIGPLLDKVLEATIDLEVNVLYQNTIRDLSHIPDAFFVEPYYSDKLGIHVPREFLTNYGTREDHDIACGFTVENIRGKIQEYIERSN